MGVVGIDQFGGYCQRDQHFGEHLQQHERAQEGHSRHAGLGSIAGPHHGDHFARVAFDCLGRWICRLVCGTCVGPFEQSMDDASDGGEDRLDVVPIELGVVDRAWFGASGNTCRRDSGDGRL